MSAQVIAPKRSRRGFTLVELLVVISIIVILSVISFTIFTNVQKNARDAKRKADIDAIAKAFETNRTATGYIHLSSSQFHSGSIPYDPKRSAPGQAPPSGGEGCGGAGTAQYANGCWYCFKNRSGTPIAPADPGVCDSDHYLTATTPNAIGPENWRVCANLEIAIESNYFYCRSSQQ